MSIPKVALVTGAARRIGRAIALDLAQNGWAVGVHYSRSGGDADSVVAEIRKAGGAAVALQADLAVEGDAQALLQRATDALGPIGCLVNNASTFRRDEVDSADRASWDAHLETNLRAPFVLIQSMARLLPAAENGVVVNMLDQRVWNLTPHFLSYTLSKSGLWTLTRTLALALAPRIRVNAIGPGPTLPSERQSEEQFRRQYESVPLRKPVAVPEICEAVRFLISAGSMTGQMIALDGGQHLAWRHSYQSSEDCE
ncbi:MAG: SDR family oxidoreductase [Alphaproteobacteria bacterium]|nr:SDR family oxidoreductase [Alphaproteobacteria bacterium]